MTVQILGELTVPTGFFSPDYHGEYYDSVAYVIENDGSIRSNIGGYFVDYSYGHNASPNSNNDCDACSINLMGDIGGMWSNGITDSYGETLRIVVTMMHIMYGKGRY